jgi:hypothetical protein
VLGFLGLDRLIRFNGTSDLRFGEMTMVPVPLPPPTDIGFLIGRPKLDLIYSASIKLTERAHRRSAVSKNKGDTCWPTFPTGSTVPHPTAIGGVIALMHWGDDGRPCNDRRLLVGRA